jgi:PAS domain S-box-containing protein
MKKTVKKSSFPIQVSSRSQSAETAREPIEETLREKENFIRHVNELSPVVLDVYDLVTGHHTYFSSDALKVYGYTGDEMAQMQDPFAALLQPEDIPRILENVNRLKRLGDGEINEFECRIRRGDGERRWINARSMIFARDEKGEARQIISATFDVTERKETEEKLIESEKRFRSYFELGLIGMAITSPTKGCLAVNDEFCKILGYERGELLKKNWTEMTHPDDIAADVANFNRVMAGEIDGYRLDKRWIRKDGRIIDTTISAKCVRRADGSVDYFVALVEDVTARKQLENERQKFVSLAENSTEFIGICDMDFVPVFINEAGAKMVGLESPEQVGQMLVRDFFFEEDRELVVGEFFKRVLRDGAGELEVRMRNFKTGEPLWMIFTTFIITNTDGEPIGLGTVSRNMTERKHLEDTLRESEENYRVIVNQAVAGIFKLDLSGKVTFSNQRFCEMLDYTCEELLEMSAEQIVYAEDSPRNNRLFERLKNQGLSYEIEKRLVRKDGSLVWVNNQVSPVFDRRCKPESVIVVSVDITERREAEEALRQANDELEHRVIKRTRQLSDLNEDLKKEIEQRERVEADRERLLRRSVSAQEDERRRIAREMHDQLGQNLSALALKLSALKNDYDRQPELSEHFASLKKIVKQLDADVGLLVHELRPTALDDFGLVIALSNYVRNWSKQCGIRAELHTNGMEKDRLTSEIETVLYRITQEALTNIAKHANAENVDILLERRSDHASLIVEDDGGGFDVDQAFGSSGKGFGLISMRERAALVAGTLAVESNPGAGATIVVRIPAAYVPSGGNQNV